MEPLTGPELCARLDCDKKELAAWVRAGLPFVGPARRKRFDPPAVAEWLLAHGHATEKESPGGDQPIAHTVEQVAKHFGVSHRTVFTWIGEGMPGRRGHPGRREGYFPLIDIDNWLEGRRADVLNTGDTTKSQAQARQTVARAKLLELELEERRGKLVDVDEQLHRWMRHIHEAKALASQLPSRIVSRLPPDISAEIRARIRADVQHALKQMFASLHSFLMDEAEAVEALAVAAREETVAEPPAEGGG